MLFTYFSRIPVAYDIETIFNSKQSNEEAGQIKKKPVRREKFAREEAGPACLQHNIVHREAILSH
jgi:hypothetical protein